MPTESERVLTLVNGISFMLENEVDLTLRIVALKALLTIQEGYAENAMQQKMMQELAGYSTNH